ncbi:MAG: hypothetical protein V4757_06720 [Pseudomonadota bacterium]
MRTIATALTICVTLVGCATPTTGVVPRGDGFFTVTRQGDSFLITTDSLKNAALKEAGDKCAGKTLQVINVKEIQAGPLGRWPEAEVTFRCT